MQLVAGTSNSGKIKRMQAALSPIGIEVLPPKLAVSLSEDGRTVEENAEQKATAHVLKLGVPVLASDEALVLDGIPLDQQPGTQVRRFGRDNHRANDEEMVAYYSDLFQRHGGSVTGHWKYAFSLAFPNGYCRTFSLFTPDRLFVATPCPTRVSGFPISSLQIESTTGKYVAELTLNETNRIWYRVYIKPLQKFVIKSMTELILHDLDAMGSERNREGMARFGINIKRAYGTSVSNLRRYSRPYRNCHPLAIELWKSKIHEARIMAGIIENHNQVTEAQMDRWTADFDSWDVCDETCLNLFSKIDIAPRKAEEWSGRAPEFEKRAGLALMATLTVHRRDLPDEVFLRFLTLIEKEAIDERNFVKKAAVWALRQVGNHNINLRKHTIETARRLKNSNSKSARWVGSRALRELQPLQTVSAHI
ncbi:DNA alkylation repair protein [Patescibacteria group bacterium]|nr:DNA alkylation repair protein [Patescibacteria group bacterium]